MNYDWPGNIRELRTAIEHGVVMSNEEFIERRHPPSRISGAKKVESSTLPEKMESSDTFMKNELVISTELNLSFLEQKAIELAMLRAKGNKSHAAVMLGISRRTLQRKLQDTNLYYDSSDSEK